MATHFYTYKTLCNLIPWLTCHSSTPVSVEEINPLIERFLNKCNASLPAIGGHSALLSTDEGIAAKISFKLDDERLQHEQEIFDELEKSPSPYIVRCLLSRPNIIFMPFIKSKNLHDRIREKDRPSPTLSWMFQLTSAAAALEAIGFAHGDINPFNILIDNQDQLTLVDLDHTLPIGSELEVGNEPYVRVHMQDESEGGAGVYGNAGPETEQFALGSIFWYVARGKELYADMSGYDRVETLCARQFPDLEPDNPIDNIISRCWKGKFAQVADILREIEKIAAEQGILDSISGTESLSNVEYLAKRKLCEHYYSLLHEDSETKSVETSIPKEDNIHLEKNTGSIWKEKAYDVVTYFKRGFNYNESIHLTLTVTITVSAALVLTSCLRKKL